MLSAEASEAMLSSSKKKSDEIFANLLVDYNEKNKGGALIDSIIKGTFADTTSNQNRSKILDQI